MEREPIQHITEGMELNSEIDISHTKTREACKHVVELFDTGITPIGIEFESVDARKL